jgi:hypothetical protein
VKQAGAGRTLAVVKSGYQGEHDEHEDENENEGAPP